MIISASLYDASLEHFRSELKFWYLDIKKDKDKEHFVDKIKKEALEFIDKNYNINSKNNKLPISYKFELICRDEQGQISMLYYNYELLICKNGES